MVLMFGGAVREGFERLNARENLILRERGLRPESALGRPATLEQLGKVLGITRERVRQLESQAWRRILAYARR